MKETPKLFGQNVVIKHSRLFSLTWLDAAKATVMAGISGGLAAAKQVLLDNGELFSNQTLHVVGYAALTATVSYLLKNFFSDTKTVKEEKPEEYHH